MAPRSTSTARLLWATAGTAVIAVLLSLLYLSAEPGRMPLSEILATVFGVGITVLIAGGLTTLMYFSASSGRDEQAGGPPDGV